jgi:hypothetical protein
MTSISIIVVDFIMQNTLRMFSSLQCSSVAVFQFILPKNMFIFNSAYVRVNCGLYVRILAVFFYTGKNRVVKIARFSSEMVL